MNSDKKRLYVLSLSFLALLLSCFFINVENKAFLIFIILSIFTPLIFYVIKKRAILSIYKGQVLMIMVVMALLYVVLYYLSGLHFGFYRYKEKVVEIIKAVLLFSAITVGIETIRTVLVQQQNKSIYIIVFVVTVVVDALLEVKYNSFTSFNRFMDFIGLTLFPSITFNLLFCYLAKRFGVLPGMVYKIITKIIPTCIVFTPAIPDSLLSFTRLILPILIFLFIRMLYEKKKPRRKKVNRVANITITCVSLVIMSLIMAVVSCQFRFCAIVIATESMTGELNKGDMVVYERFSNQTIEENQILVFDRDGATTVHRVVKVEIINGQTRYITKGDFNEDVDSGYVTNSDIQGVVHFKLAYLGYPTLWMRDIFKK